MTKPQLLDLLGDFEDDTQDKPYGRFQEQYKCGFISYRISKGVSAYTVNPTREELSCTFDRGVLEGVRYIPQSSGDWVRD